MDKNKAIQSKRDYDILNMLNSISNFEIFTPFEVAQNMVNLLPEEVFKEPSYKFLDPCVKSGIFLREIIYKLNDNLPRIKYTDIDSGVTYDLSNKKERTSHILRNMIYGIAISELTAYVSRRTIYGVMDANVDKESEFLDSKILSSKKDINADDLYFNDYYDHTIFNTEDRKGYEKEGNIFYPCEETNIENEDTHHPFINKTEHKFINLIKEGKVKFNVIIGNPPYQKNDGGGKGSSAIPIYNIFIENSINLNPDYVSMIIPSRWFSGGKGLDGFRDYMLNNKISHIIDYENSKDCFNNVDIEGGVSYFLYNKNHISNICNFTKVNNNISISKKIKLNEYDVLVRDYIGIDVVKKIKEKEKSFLSEIVSPRRPFDVGNNFEKRKSNDLNVIKIFTGDNYEYIDILKVKNIEKYKSFKVVISKANGAAIKNKSIISKPLLLEKGSVCTEKFLIINSFDNIEDAKNCITFIKTNFFRFLLSLRKSTQNTSMKNFSFIPNLDMSEKWNDEKLYKYFNLSNEEIEYIEKTIKPME